MTENMHDNIVQYAAQHGITDLGQLSDCELKQLRGAVKKGDLMKMFDVSYPRPKTVYCTWQSLKLNQVFSIA